MLARAEDKGSLRLVAGKVRVATPSWHKIHQFVCRIQGVTCPSRSQLLTNIVAGIEVRCGSSLAGPGLGSKSERERRPNTGSGPGGPTLG